MKKVLLICLLLIPVGAMGQTQWYSTPRPNMCRGAAPGGAMKWTNCPVAWQLEIIEQGRRADVSDGSFALRQDVVAKVTPPKAPAKIEEAKPKPIILDKVKLLELSNLRLVLENAQLKAQAAIPAELAKGMKDAGDAVGKFWQAVGINPDELSTKWTATNGVDGAIILTPVAEKKDVAPTAPPK